MIRLILTATCAAGRTSLLLATFLLAGCGSKESGKAASVGPGAAGVSGAETTETVIVRQDLEFFSERYLPAEERLRRRQQRLLAILDAPVTSAGATP